MKGKRYTKEVSKNFLVNQVSENMVLSLGGGGGCKIEAQQINRNFFPTGAKYSPVLYTSSLSQHSMTLVTLYTNLGDDGIMHGIAETEVSTIICSFETFGKFVLDLGGGVVNNFHLNHVLYLRKDTFRIYRMPIFEYVGKMNSWSGANMILLRSVADLKCFFSGSRFGTPGFVSGLLSKRHLDAQLYLIFPRRNHHQSNKSDT
jgi:hypothetical protein